MHSHISIKIELRNAYIDHSLNRLYYDNVMVHRLSKMKDILPTSTYENKVICITGVGVKKEFSTIITNTIADFQLQANGQCFPSISTKKEGK